MKFSPPSISLSQISDSAARYFRSDLKADAIAGLTVAVMGVPQAMAYALIAGLPPVWGLYTAIVTCTVAALFGSSNHLVTGPTNALCMVVLSLTAHLPDKYGYGLLEITLLLTFLTGVTQLLFGLLNLGGIIRYVSHSVVIGFTAGAGILIAINQIKNILGIHFDEHAERFHETVYYTFKALPETNPYSLSVALLTIACVLLLPKINAKLPSSLIGIIVSGAIAYSFGWHEIAMGIHKIEIVKDIEPIQANLNLFHLPQLLTPPPYELTRELGLGAVALAILGLIEAASIARAVAAQSGQRLNFNREFTAQGLSNIAGSFFSSFAGSGSFTRTAVCYKSGGRTRMAAIFSAVWTALTVLLLAGVANYIPKAALAGILVVVAYSMVDKHRLAVTWKSGTHSRMVLFGTLFSTLLLPLEYAIFVGVFLSILILLRVTGQADITQLVQREDSGFDEIPFNKAAPSEVVTVNLEGDLYFAAAEDLDYELLNCLTPKTRVVILRMKRLRAVGSSAMAILEHFWELLHARGVHLVVCGIEDALKKVMTGSGLRKQLGEQNIFYADNKLFQSTELALARAWSIAEMERRRQRNASEPETKKLDTSITAKDIASPKILRFGNQHQIREATWLVSEMMKHRKQKLPQPLFLQDRDGKLHSELPLHLLLKALTEGIDPKRISSMSDEEIVGEMRLNFGRSILEITRKEIPRIKADCPFHTVAEISQKSELKTLPIIDENGRLSGLVSGLSLLEGIAKGSCFQPEKELPHA